MTEKLIYIFAVSASSIILIGNIILLYISSNMLRIKKRQKEIIKVYGETPQALIEQRISTDFPYIDAAKKELRLNIERQNRINKIKPKQNFNIPKYYFTFERIERKKAIDNILIHVLQMRKHRTTKKLEILNKRVQKWDLKIKDAQADNIS